VQAGWLQKARLAEGTTPLHTALGLEN